MSQLKAVISLRGLMFWLFLLVFFFIFVLTLWFSLDYTLAQEVTPLLPLEELELALGDPELAWAQDVPPVRDDRLLMVTIFIVCYYLCKYLNNG